MEINKIENANARMQPIRPGYSKFVGSAWNSTSEHELKLKQKTGKADFLKEEILELKQEQLNLVTEDLNRMGFNELEQLERKMKEGLKSLNTWKLKNDANISKDEILNLKLKQLRQLVKDLHGMGLHELEQLEKEPKTGILSVWAWKTEKPRGSHLATVPPAPVCFGYNPCDQRKDTFLKNISLPAKNNESPNAISDGGAEDDYQYDKALYWWRFRCLVLVICVCFLLVFLPVLLF